MPEAQDILPVFSLSGSPEEMGTQHGRQAAARIREGVGPRLDLCRAFPAAHGRPRTDAEIRALAEACRPAHEAFCPGLMAELRATADGHLLIGQTWDMYASALPFVCLLTLQPAGAPAALMVSLAGCVGMFGLNAAGLAVCTNNLHAAAGRPGVFWPFLMRRILACHTYAEAAALLDTVELAGGHNFLLAGPSGEIGEWEILPFRRVHRAVTTWTTHTNHCLHPTTQAEERVDGAIGRASSEERYAQARDFFAKKNGPWRPSDLASLTRTASAASPHAICMRPVEGYPVQTCAAAVFRPATGEAWTLRGLPTEGAYRRHLVPGRDKLEVAPDDDFS